MKVLTIDITPNILGFTQAAWIDLEYAARETFAHARLDNLAMIGANLTPADRFDAAYAIWDDFIDGRRADDWFEKPKTRELRAQAGVFARASFYLPASELASLAEAAWGSETFEVYITTVDGVRLGKLGWYGNGTLSIRFLGTPGVSRTVSNDRGRLIDDVRHADVHHIGLHPVFARTDS
jgi:hypothetical protein